MKGIVGKGLVLLLIVIAQVSILPRMSLGNLQPDLFLIAACCWGLIKGSRIGMGAGFAAGLLQDLYGTGSNIFIKPAIGYISGRFEGKIFKESIVFPPMIIFGASIFSGIITYLVHEEFLFNLSFGYALGEIVIPGAVVNAALTIVAYPFLLWLERKLEERPRGVYH